MKNYDYWKKFIGTGKIDDYLNYIACTREESMDDILQGVEIATRGREREKEGGVVAGISYRDGDGSVGHASW
ncbi:MAG TPA: hypothetical protein VN258_16620 [Mobilitalea sp.]|nr:hypothetical protein [Mobilitalea sp.]